MPRIPLIVVTAAEPHWGYPATACRVVRKQSDIGSVVAVVAEIVAGIED